MQSPTASALSAVAAAFALASCGTGSTTRVTPDAAGADHTPSAGPSLPLFVVADVPLPGGATRFDYQDIDSSQGHIVIAHMNDGAVVIANLSDGSTVKQLTVFDVNKPGVALIGHDSPGSNSHSVAADPASHRVFFPLMAGPRGTPVLRIMSPSGI